MSTRTQARLLDFGRSAATGRGARAAARLRTASQLLLLPLLLLAALPARAQTVAVLGVGGQGDADLQRRIGGMLMDAVGYQPSLEGIDRRDVNLDEAVMLLGCTELDVECQGELASTLEVDRVLYASLEGAGPDVHVVYFDSVEHRDLLDNTFPAATSDDLDSLENDLIAGVAERAVLQVTSQRENVNITIDGSPAGVAPIVSLDLPPGNHTVEATCDQCETMSEPVDLTLGQFTRIDLTPATTAVAVTEPATHHATSRGGGSRLAPVLTISAGGALLVTGVVFAFLTQSTQNDFDKTPSLSRAESLAITGETQALLTNIFLATGAAATATGIILLLTMGGGEETPPQQTVGLRATPWVGPGAGGVSLDWTF